MIIHPAPGRTLPRRYRLQHVFVSRSTGRNSQKIAQLKRTCTRLLAKPLTSRETVRSYSEDRATRDRGGDLGWISESRLPSSLREPLLKLEVGELSDVLESPMGWHLIKLVEVRVEEKVVAAPGDLETDSFLLDQQRQVNLQAWLAQQKQHADVKFFPRVLAQCHPSHP